MTDQPTGERQRLDQWLWQSRLIKSRSRAQRLIETGAVRVNRVRIIKPGHQIKTGDVLTFIYADNLHVVEVKTTAKRRGPASEARQLYEDVLPDSCEQSTHGDRKGDA
ncbi:MAG: RNA-binding S4 domain-containing protein [Aestuariivirgaceae bacterium]